MAYIDDFWLLWSLKIFKAPEKGLLVHLDVLLEAKINGYRINGLYVITYFYMVCILGL